MPSRRLSRIELIVMGVASIAMVALSWFQAWSLGMTEVLGFVTGGVCVWLTVRENMWTWPIGLANNIAFFVLFEKARLYADMTLQIVYFALGVWGWINWLHGGDKGAQLAISRARRGEWIAIALSLPIATWGMQQWLIVLHDASPFLDALTTVLSLVAQYLLCRKRLENWWVWIIADIIYIPLYFYRSLPLTGVLYAVFLAMCIVGLRQWTHSLHHSRNPT